MNSNQILANCPNILFAMKEQCSIYWIQIIIKFYGNLLCNLDCDQKYLNILVETELQISTDLKPRL